MPVADSLAELNEKIIAWDEADNARRIDNRIRTVEQDFEVERSFLAWLPFERFEPGPSLTPGRLHRPQRQVSDYASAAPG